MQIELAPQVFIAPTASLANGAGVKNLRWHLAHEVIAGTLLT
jgi:hypothetical protein